MTQGPLLTDSQGRIVRDLRVSVTDRCNSRCLYCLPETEAALNFYRGHWAKLPASAPIVREWEPRANLLSFEEIERVARLVTSLGVQKIRLTGGEPLLRRDLEKLVERLARIAGLKDLAMTSNGFFFAQNGRALRDAGLRRISFSLDSLDRANFKRITGRDRCREVLASIELAQELGLNPVKVNAVIIRDLNDHEIEPLVEYSRRQNVSLRFIEFMPLDSARAWLKELVVPGAEILRRLQARYPLVAMASDNPSVTARRWSFADGRGEVGIITTVTEPFCSHCSRMRLTADGKIRTCLFSVIEHDLRARLRDSSSDDDLRRYLQEVAGQKEERHHVGEADFVPPSRSMSCIGG